MKRANNGKEYHVTVNTDLPGDDKMVFEDHSMRKENDENGGDVEEEANGHGQYPEGCQVQQAKAVGGATLLQFQLDGVLSTDCGCNDQVEGDDGCDSDAVKEHILECLQPESVHHARLMRAVRTIKNKVMHHACQLDVARLASKLASAGYQVRLRSAIAGGDGVACFTHLSNAFLVLDYEEGEYIVETSFRDHFAIPRSTKRYKRLLATVPEEMVLPTFRVKPLVAVLCQEMSRSFAARRMCLPPWRQDSSLLSKWLPSRVYDMDVNALGFISMWKESSAPGLGKKPSIPVNHRWLKNDDRCPPCEFGRTDVGGAVEGGGSESEMSTSLLSKTLAPAQQYQRQQNRERALASQPAFSFVAPDTQREGQPNGSEKATSSMCRKGAVSPENPKHRDGRSINRMNDGVLYGSMEDTAKEKDPGAKQMPTSPGGLWEPKATVKSGFVWEGSDPIRIVRRKGVIPKLSPAA